VAAKITGNIAGARRAMKQPLIEGDAIACKRAIRLADCVVAKLIICYLMVLTNCFNEANYTARRLESLLG
jgi:hypothetical protein